MIIERKLNGENYSIELTEEELVEAYREQELQYRKLDAELHIADFLFSIGRSGIPEMNAEKEKEFTQLKEELAYQFLYKEVDCNVAENDTWNFIIDKYEEEIRDFFEIDLIPKDF